MGLLYSLVANYLFSSDTESDGTPDMNVSQSGEEGTTLDDLVTSSEESSSSKSTQKKETSDTTRTQLLDELNKIQTQLEQIRSRLQSLVEGLKLPVNPLDELIDQLGGESMVAEMTGRTHRILHHHPGIADSSTQYLMELKQSNRTPETVDMNELRINEDYFYYEDRGIKRGSDEGINMREKELFQQGIKRVAIISEAASAGISLHSDRCVPNQAKRLHIILELPWSADKIIQQCGRSHRSNQRVPPDYVFLLSAIGGEVRFISTISKRLRALGALTQGSRNATGALDFSQFDFNSSYAKKAVTLLLDTILVQSPYSKVAFSPPGETLFEPGVYEGILVHEDTEKTEYEAYKQASGVSRLRMMQKWLQDVDYQYERNDATVSLFNRLLGMELWKQQILVRYLDDVSE